MTRFDHQHISKEQILEMTPQSLVEYTEALGWKRRQTKRTDIAVFSHPTEKYEQVLIPRNKDYDDFPERMVDVLVKLASFKGQSDPAVLIQDVLNHEADILRFVWKGADTASGSINLLSGVGFLEGAKKALLSSACSVIHPSTYHPRLSRSEANQLLSASRLNHTEQGSFVISISCPLYAVDLDPSVFGETPFTRKVTQLLMLSLGKLVYAIEQGETDSLLEENEDEVVISANLCKAILDMQADSIDSLDLGVSWGAAYPSPTPAIPSTVRIRREYTKNIERIRERLQPKPAKQSKQLFVGTVEVLNGEVDADGRRSGEVTLNVFNEDEVVRVRVDLDAEQYKDANTAHMNGSLVRIQGVMSPGNRIHRLSQLQSFTILE